MNRFTAAVLTLLATGLLVWAFRPAPRPPELVAGTPDRLVTVALDSARTGSREVTVTVTDRAGNPAPVAGVEVTAVLTGMGHAGTTASGVPIGSSSYRVTGVHLMTPGDWLLVVVLDGGPTRDPINVPVTVTA